jgi:hypothetical protein
MNKRTKLVWGTLLLLLLFSISMLMGILLHKYGYISRLNKQINSWSDGRFTILVNSTFKTVNPEINNYISTNNYKFNFKEMKLPSMSFYGALESFEGNLLFVDGQGSLFEISDNDKVKKIAPLKIQNNLKDFKKEYDGANFSAFTIKDMIISSSNGKNTMFLSSIGFDKNEKCYFMSVFSSNFTKENGVFRFFDFDNIFKSRPCLYRHPLREFAGESSGGRLAHDGRFVYLSIGDFQFDGVNAQNLLQSKDSDYGKILQIDPISRAYQTVAQGLRNPQGMALTNIGLFETEHGPQGGDEFNLINLSKIEDHGWPKATYGTDYGKTYWPLDPNNLNHNIYNFQDPLHFWTPGIGISNLKYVEKNNLLNLWEGNFLISSLRAMSIYRMQMDQEKRVIGIEKIKLGFRIRDIEIINGKIYTLEDPATIHIMEVVNE